MERSPADSKGPGPSAPRHGSDEGARSEVLATCEGQRPWGSFHLATVMFRRAVQLRNGARPRVHADGRKFLQIAFIEVTTGVIPWEIGRG
jgi:RNA polymerase Rpb6